MQPWRNKRFPVLAGTLLLFSLPAVAQVVIATTPAGAVPYGVAVNPNTNKAYVSNQCGNDPTCNSPGTVTVATGASNNTSTVTAGDFPVGVAVNPVTNKIYVANSCGNDISCASVGTVTVIDGATNNTTTVTVGFFPYFLAVNSVTNKIYVTNYCGNDASCSSAGTVTVIDGATNNTSTITVGDFPLVLAVNTASNKIYVANTCGNDLTCNSAGTVTVIDANNNNSTATVNVGFVPNSVDLNSITNKVYVANYCGGDLSCNSAGTVTAIDGTTNNTTTIPVGVLPDSVAVNSTTNMIYVANECGNDVTCSSPGTATIINGTNNNRATLGVAIAPYSVAVNSTTNKIYVTNFCGNDLSCKSPAVVSAIDGATNSIIPVAIGDAPSAIAVNPASNLIYVPNQYDGTVSVIGGNAVLQLVNVTPCRLVDTRPGAGGGGPIQGGTFQTFNLPQLSQMNNCGDLSTAAAYSLNVALIPSHGPVGYLTIWPAGQVQPYVAIMTSDGRIKSNAAIVPAGVSGAVSVFVTDTADVVLDIYAYFAPSGPSTLQFYKLPPCRVADTRNASYPSGLGPPALSPQTQRNFPVLSSNCGIPGNAAAYSLNVTAVPYGSLDYLTVWPTGENKPYVATLNALTGTVTGNAAIVPAGSGGGISAFAYNVTTDLVIDIDGYFAPPAQGGLSLYPTVPCRVLDTRPPLGNGAFTGELMPPVDVLGSPCGVPSQSQAYVFNATVVPLGSLGYLTFWPDGGSQPDVATLNAYDGAITSNMAIVPSGNFGKVDAYAGYGTTNLVIDISSYFAP